MRENISPRILTNAHEFSRPACEARFGFAPGREVMIWRNDGLAVANEFVIAGA